MYEDELQFSLLGSSNPNSCTFFGPFYAEIILQICNKLLFCTLKFFFSSRPEEIVFSNTSSAVSH